MKCQPAWIPILAIALCHGCGRQSPHHETNPIGPAVGGPIRGVIQKGTVVGIGVVPNEFALSARKALDAGGINYEYDSNLGATGFRVYPKFEAKAIAVLQADAKRHAYKFTLAR